MARKKFGPDLESEVVDEFNQWIKREGLQGYRAGEAAFRVFMLLPTPVREAARLGNMGAVKAWIERAEQLVARETAMELAEGERHQEARAGKGRKAGGKGSAA